MNLCVCIFLLMMFLHLLRMYIPSPDIYLKQIRLNKNTLKKTLILSIVKYLYIIIDYYQ